MTTSPLRHMLFMCLLLFVILSSGSLQCALNCYEHAVRTAESATFVTDCHPLTREEIRTEHLGSFCHRSHSTSQAQGDPVLRSFFSAPTLALLNVRAEAPPCRSAEQVESPLLTRTPAPTFASEVLPPSQRLRQVRSTVLLM